jgi:TolC family type I secretion outer membrane protein
MTWTVPACALAAALVTLSPGVAGRAAAQAPPAAPAGPLRLSLAEAVALALRQQPTIRAAESSRLAAEARVPQARAGYYPRVDLSSSTGSTQAFSTSQDRTLRSDSTGLAVQGRQLLWDFGKTASTVDEARAGSRVAEGEVDRVRDVVVQNVRQAYFGVLQARRLVSVADASLARAELNLRSARGFFEVGTKPKSDVTRAEVEVATARVNLIRARNSVRLAETTLANTLGLDATVPIEVEDILTYEPVALDPAALVAEALSGRPELRQAQARLDASRATLANARAGYWPDLTLNGSYGTTSGDALVGVGGVATAPAFGETWSVSANLSWSLFQGFFTQNRIREAQALVEAARANAETLELQVRLEVEQAYIGVVEAGERIGANEKAVESAQENLRLAQGRYDAGVGTILDLTDAQLALTQAEADQVRALTDFRVGLAVLDRVVGRR